MRVLAAIAFCAWITPLIVGCSTGSGGAKNPNHGAHMTAPTTAASSIALSSTAPTSGPTPTALSVPTRTLRFDVASMQFPVNLPAPKQDGTYLFTEGTADQVDSSITNGKSIVVGVNIYASPAAEFGKRPGVRDWAEHAMPPNSSFRRATNVPARSETLKIAGANEAMISVSQHDGFEAFGTGGQRALSIRLFVKDPRNDGSGWVVGAYAYGDANDPQIAMDSQLARELEQILRSFQLGADAAKPH